MRIDGLDRQIIALLVDGGRRSFRDIGAEVGLSAPAVKRRVDRLLDAGIVTGFSARLDYRALGTTTEAFVELFCRGHTSPRDILEIAARHPQVVAVYTVTGDADALLHLRTTDIGELESTLERVRADLNVDRTRSTVVLSRLLERPVSLPPVDAIAAT